MERSTIRGFPKHAAKTEWLINILLIAEKLERCLGPCDLVRYRVGTSGGE